MRVVLILMLCTTVMGLNHEKINLAKDYFSHKNIKHVSYLSCANQNYNLKIAKDFVLQNSRILVVSIKMNTNIKIDNVLRQHRSSVGVILDGFCNNVASLLEKASELKFFDSSHSWLVFVSEDYNSTEFIEENFYHLNLSIDTDITIVSSNGSDYMLTDVFNFGKIQGNELEITSLGAWRPDTGLNIYQGGYKYYHRWNFHNLTLRAVSVISNAPKVFVPALLSDSGYSAGVAAMTKITSQVLNTLKKQHNYRFNYTIVDRWIGNPKRNSTLAVTNSLYWGEQDISSTCARIFPLWLNWVDICFPPTTALQLGRDIRDRVDFTDLVRDADGKAFNTKKDVVDALNLECVTAARKCGAPPANNDFAMTALRSDIPPSEVSIRTKFYYLMVERGVGSYENQFLTPLSLGVWWSTLAACVLCCVVLAAAACLESRPQPGLYAFFSVSAALFQQDFEDGGYVARFSSQGRKLTLLVVGITSMLLYNYYTSSVVSWLLNAAAPSIDTLEQLIDSDLELVFEDIGYTRGWFDNPGFYYYSGFVNPVEDKMREQKVLKAKRTVQTLMSVKPGIELIKTGSYAFHTEPYSASQEISHTFLDEQLCALGSLRMMLPAHVYIMVQKRSPYREFFTWSLMRLNERGHLQASRRRFADTTPACSGRKPRALALGQAAPAFLVLLQLALLSLIILLAERAWYRFHPHEQQ